MEVHGQAGTYPVACPNARAGGYTLKVAVVCTEPMPQQVAVRSCDLWGSCTEAVPEGSYTAKTIHAGAILEELHLWEGRHTETGEEDLEEETAKEKCYKLMLKDHNCFSLFLCLACGEEEVEEFGVNLSLGRRISQEKVFYFCFIYHCAIQLLIVNKLI